MSWNNCLDYLRSEVPATDFQTWLAPLQCEIKNNHLFLYAPNKFVADWVSNKYLKHINDFYSKETNSIDDIILKVGSLKIVKDLLPDDAESLNNNLDSGDLSPNHEFIDNEIYNQTLIKEYTFNNYVEGKCNMLARAAAMQIVDTSDSTSSSVYNPFLIYGGVGLGKTHLLHAIGNCIVEHKSSAKVLYITSQKFVHDMVTAFQNKSIDKFKSYYGSVDALLVDDIQFFADKERSQEEFFHIFNHLLEGQKQIIMTCDTYPKEVKGIEDRLISRFSWGLSVGIEMPDIETRVAILISKASALAIDLPQDVAFFIAQNVQSNIRELEGALKRVIATSRFLRKSITIEFAKDALKDLLSAHQKLISLENIQKTVSSYYKIRVSDLHSKSRQRTIARPRQLAMYLSKEFTNFSTSAIGDSFGGRDHSTVLHACKAIKKLLKDDLQLKEDMNNLTRILTGG